MTTSAPGSWIEGSDSSIFPVTNLPYGVFTTDDRPQDRRIGIAIGEYILDVGAVARSEELSYRDALSAPVLNDFMAQGQAGWSDLRARITEWFTEQRWQGTVEPHLIEQDAAHMHLPFEVGDYVDFYSSRRHAENLGRMFRPDQESLLPNWLTLPIGYHGRAGTVRVSGTPVTRPRGLRKRPEDESPTFGPSRSLDIEAEVGFIVGSDSALGSSISVDQFSDYVFGACLVNDWSARDIQAWEYVPLGPFLGKSFLTSVSPWVVPLPALEHARNKPPQRTHPVPDYLDDASEPWGLDLTLGIRINDDLVSQPDFGDMYWTCAQQLAHMTANGAALRIGDLFASGTVSSENGVGSLIELTWNGTRPLELSDGSTRKFLEDGDEVVISATAPGQDGTTIGFGEVIGRVSAP